MKQKIDKILTFMINDVASTRKTLIGSQIGDYNRAFAENWSKYFHNSRLTELSIANLIPKL